MNIYELLKKDHRKLESLLDELLQCSESDDQQWKSILTQIRDDIVPHSRAEEAVFYNSLREEGQAGLQVAESYLEHAMAENQIRLLESMGRMDVNWTAAVEKLRSAIRHHIQEEENRLFASAREIFSEEEANQLGEAFQKLKPEMKSDSESMVQSTIDLVENLLPKRVVGTFRKYFGEKGRKAA